MIRYKLSYLTSLLFLFIFTVVFLSVDFFMPHLRSWKSDKMRLQSQVYLDESIDKGSGLLEDGVRKAKIAFLLDPENEDTFENYNLLLFRTNPSVALENWSAKLVNQGDEIEKRINIFEKSLTTLRDDTLSPLHRKRAGDVAFTQMKRLTMSNNWIEDPKNALLVCNLLAETGNQIEALRQVKRLLERHPGHPQALFLLTRLSVHLKEISQLPSIGQALAGLSAQRDETGLEAIRHMTLLHLMQPLSPGSLNKCIQLLQANKHAHPIDFLRVHALRVASSPSEKEKKVIIKNCSELFNLENPKDLLIFSNWLARLRHFQDLLSYLPTSKAKVDENLFKIRMNALAHLNDTESIHREVRNSPIIPQRWRFLVEARAFALAGNFKEASAILDRLIPVLGEDYRKVRAICQYLENSGDVPSLVHILEKLIDKPIHKRFALQKLMQHRSASASLEDLLGWMGRLSQTEDSDPTFSESYLYFELLNPQLPSPSQKLDQLIAEAKVFRSEQNTMRTRITLALAHLRNNSADLALVALGRAENWREWANTRSAWAFIAAQIFNLNHSSEKALVISSKIDFNKMDRAERESLNELFPRELSLTE
tara:strand:+ start:426 stop:2213 length:1788 start_codon:yes stop_codon:yes gene_type:complete